jgi:HK97 gp10 family phage protein
MAKGAGFVTYGIKEIEQVLAGLPDKFGQKVVEEVLVKSSKILVNQIKQNASHSDVTGNLRKSIGIIKSKEAGLTKRITIGPRRHGPYKGYHAHLLEYGTVTRRAEKAKVLAGHGIFFGKQVEGVTAQPFMRPAYDACIGNVQDEIAKEFRSILESGFKKVFK